MREALWAALTAATLPALALAAQDTRPAPALTCRTADEELAEDIVSPFERGQALALPKLARGQHWVIRMDQDGVVEVTAATGEVAMLELEARPAALLDIYADEVDQVRRLATGAGMLSLQALGMSAREAAGLMKTIFEFPKQISLVQSKFRARRPEFTTFDLELLLTPVAESGFENLCRLLKPNPRGVPVLAEENAMHLAVSLDAPALRKELAPLLTRLARMFVKADAEAAVAVMRQATDLSDGTFAGAYGPLGNMTFANGITDTAAWQQLVESPEYARFAASSLAGGGVEYTPEALRHAGVRVGRTVVTMPESMPVSPGIPGGKVTQFSCAVANLALTAATQGEIEALIDAAAAGRIARRPLPDNAVVEFTIRLADLAPEFAELRAPKTVHGLLGPGTNGLFVKVTAR